MLLFATLAKWPRHERRPIIGADRKCSARSQNDKIDPTEKEFWIGTRNVCLLVEQEMLEKVHSVVDRVPSDAYTSASC